MGMAQFAKVVLLPQGDFAAFLRATPEDRREVLERLFDITAFSDVEAWLAETRRTAGADLEQARTTLGAPSSPGSRTSSPRPARATGDGRPLGEVPPERPARAGARGRRPAGRPGDDDDDRLRRGPGHRAGRGRRPGRRPRPRGGAHPRAARARAAGGPASGRPAHDDRVRVVGAAERAAGLLGHLSAHDRATDDEAAAATTVGRSRTLLDTATGGALADLPDDEVRATTTPRARARRRRRRPRPARPRRPPSDDGATTGSSRRPGRSRGAARSSPTSSSRPSTTARRPQEQAARAGRVGRPAVGELELRLTAARERVDVLDALEADLALAAELRPRRDDLRAVALDRRSALLDLRQRRLDGMAAELARSLAPGEPARCAGASSTPTPPRSPTRCCPTTCTAPRTTSRSPRPRSGASTTSSSALLARADTRRAGLGDADARQLVQVVEGTTADLARAAPRGRRARPRDAAGSTRPPRPSRPTAASWPGWSPPVRPSQRRSPSSPRPTRRRPTRVSALRDDHDGCPCGSEDPDVHGRASRALGEHRAAVEALDRRPRPVGRRVRRPRVPRSRPPASTTRAPPGPPCSRRPSSPACAPSWRGTWRTSPPPGPSPTTPRSLDGARRPGARPRRPRVRRPNRARRAAGRGRRAGRRLPRAARGRAPAAARRGGLCGSRPRGDA